MAHRTPIARKESLTLNIYLTKSNNYSYMALTFEKNSVILRGEDAKLFVKSRGEKTAEYTENTYRCISMAVKILKR